jgi:foldase protein PrsA
VIRPLRFPAVALVALLLLSACSKATSPAATVNGANITDAQLSTDEALFSFLAGLSQQPCGTKVGAETQAQACARFTLANLIQEDIVKAYAATNKVTVSDATVTNAISQLETSMGGAPALDAKLKTDSLTRPDLTALAKRLLLFNEVQKSIGASKVTDPQLQASYEGSKAQFTQLHAAHILVKTKAEAVKIRAQVTAKNFADLAKKFSIDTGSATQGGDLGTVPAFGAGLDTTFVQAALALKPGQISQPVQTQFGWHIIMLISADVQPFEQVKAQLLAQLSGQAFQTWLMDQLKTAKITINPKYGKFDPATGEVVPITSTATGTQAAGPSASPASSASGAPASP